MSLKIALPLGLRMCPGRPGHNWTTAEPWYGPHPALAGLPHGNPNVRLGDILRCSQCLAHIRVPIAVLHAAVDITVVDDSPPPHDDTLLSGSK